MATPPTRRTASVHSVQACLATAVVAAMAVCGVVLTESAAHASGHPARRHHGHHHGHHHRRHHRPTPTARPTDPTSVLPRPSAPPTSPIPSPSTSTSENPTEPATPVPTPTSVTPTAPVTPDPATADSSEVFGPESEWHRDVAAAPVATNSGALVANLAAQVHDHWNGNAAFNVWSYNVAFYTASASTPRASVIWDNCQGYGWTPPTLFDPAGGADFVNVPIPDDAVPAAGSDHELSVWSPTTDQLWEFWQAHHETDGWHACWGGRIDHAHTSPGFFAAPTGVAASGLSLTAGAIGIKEVESGTIDHALSLNIVDAANWSQFSFPANRSDGSLPAGTPNAIEEGQRFRLDPDLDLSRLHLTPLARMVAQAAQRYGFIVNDKGGAVALTAESGVAAQARTGINPWDSLLGGVPSYDVFSNFPWDRLQALPVDYGNGS